MVERSRSRRTPAAKRVAEALDVLKRLNVPKAQQNERSALHSPPFQRRAVPGAVRVTHAAYRETLDIPIPLTEHGEMAIPD